MGSGSATSNGARPPSGVGRRAVEESSAVLLARWREQDDVGALEALLAREIEFLKERVRRRTSGQVTRAESASDIGQEVAVRFLTTATEVRFEDVAALRAYLWTAAWNLLRARWKRAGVADPQAESPGAHVPLDTEDAMAQIEERERSVALRVAVALLPKDAREILDLVYFRELGVAVAAERLGIRRECAKMRLVRARRELSEKLRRWKDLIDSP